MRARRNGSRQFVGLGRRGGFALSGLGALDPTLVRHVYDLSRMDGHYDAEEAVAITIQTMKAEAESRADDYPAYRADPRAETLRAFELMCKDEKFADDYAKLLDEMVYGEKPEFTSASRRCGSSQNWFARHRHDCSWQLPVRRHLPPASRPLHKTIQHHLPPRLIKFHRQLVAIHRRHGTRPRISYGARARPARRLIPCPSSGQRVRLRSPSGRIVRHPHASRRRPHR